MCEARKLELITEIARSLYDRSFEHGIYHVERVYKWSIKIIENENIEVDPVNLKTAIFLHDLGRLVGEPHAYYSALISEMLLKEAGCRDSIVEEVVKAIKSHSFSYSKNIERTNDLGKILSDADKLDALGLIGFLRVFIYSERKGRSLNDTLKHFQEKILKLHTLMNYDYSRRKAVEYTERVRELLSILQGELN